MTARSVMETGAPTEASRRPNTPWLVTTVAGAVLIALGIVLRAPALTGAGAVAVAAVLLARLLLGMRDRLTDAIRRVAAGPVGPDDALHLGPFLEPVSRALRELVVVSRDANSDLKTAIQQERMKTLELEMLANRLEETGRRLQQANEELAAFAYSASHDLASPLRVIEGLSGILEEDYGDALDDAGREHLATIRGSAARLIRLVQDLLVMSRLRNPEPADVETVALGDVVRDLVADLRPTLPANAHVQVMGTLPEVEAPPERLRQVLQNLISNGFKFNESASPTVTIDGWTEGGIGIVRVTDNGIGIPEQKESEVFGLFTRVHGDRAIEGTGAGLAIARRAARSLNGELWIERTSPAGTTFVLAVPTQHAGDGTVFAGAFGPMGFGV